MEANAIEARAAALTQGIILDATSWEVGAAATWIADALGRRDPAITVHQVRTACRALNEHLLFEHTRLLGQTWRDCGPFDATIAKRHAQALIELSALDASERILREAIQAVSQPGLGVQSAAELLEYEGLLGRIAKQRFVATGDKDSLVQASDRYLAQYRQPSRPYWHGINAVALLAREQREDVFRSGVDSSAALAEAIYEQVTRAHARQAGDPWLAAAASEASLALEECDRAEFWLYRLLHHPQLQPFHVNAYDRQLREIWQAAAILGGGSCADRLAGIISRHLMRTQGRWSISTAAVRDTARAINRNPDGLERNFSGEGGFSVEMVRRMLAACASIGCVTNTAGERLGTGFLVEGAVLNEAFTAAPVFVTNAHVISDVVPNAIRAADARVTFELEAAAATAPVAYRVREVLFTSPPGTLGDRGGGSLDVSVVRLDGLTAAGRGLAAAASLPLIDARAKAYVVGHPRGSGLQISLHDSLLLDIDDDDCLVHYRTPTDPGSSGSPVFNKQWEVMAVHHSGSAKTPRLHGEGFYEANEAIALSAVRRHLNSQGRSAP